MKNSALVRKIMIIALLTAALVRGLAQDTLYFDEHNMLTGEVKSLQKSVVRIETDYSDDDFTVEWKKVRRIYTTTYFMVYLSDGSYRYGTLNSDTDSTVRITSALGESFTDPLLDIILLRELNPRFKDRFEAGIDAGLNLAKANNLKQWTLNGNAGYNAEVWKIRATYGGLYSLQEGAETINRQEAQLIYQWLFFRDWTLNPSITFLHNSEQKLNLRTNIKLGAGKYLVYRSYGYLGVATGVNRNVEQYSNETPDRSSWEGFLGLEVNLYDLEDFSLFSSAVAYPGITEKGRWRSELKLNVKYDLPLDFYIKLDGTLNFDSQPAEGSSKYDYVSTIGFGWEW